MEQKKVVKKKKPFLKKVKIVFKKILFAILDFFENIYRKFMSLKDYVRYIIYVWVVVFVLIVILIVASASNTKFKEDYVAIENTLNEAALYYTEKNEFYPPRANKLMLQLDMLEDLGYIKKEDISDSSCVGYARVYYDNEKDSYSSQSYINCKKYTSEGYFDNK